nr:hypothetical protein [uncultured Kingella sp.]
MDTILIRFHLGVALLAVFNLIAAFSWTRLLASLAYALVYGFILWWLNEQKLRAIMYATSLFGFAFALYHVFSWTMEEPKPSDVHQQIERQYQQQQNAASSAQ